MTTKTRRIQILIDKDTKDILRLAAKYEGITMASKAKDLIRFVLDIEENTYSGKEIEKRMSLFRRV